MTTSHIVLVGLMGTGKSTVGRKLAKQLGLDFRDTDRVIEEQTGMSVAEIFASQGEDRFRLLETEVLTRLLQSLEPIVVATGGGIVTTAHNRDALHMARESGVARIFWLDASPETLHQRIGRGTSRPLLAHDPLGVLTRLSDERRGFYQSVSSHTIDTGDLTISEVVDEIIQHLPFAPDKNVS